MKSRFVQLGKDSFIYGLGGVLARGIGIFLLPIVTRIFTPLEYGTIEMLITINSFVAAVLLLGMDSAQSFFFFEQKKAGTFAQAQVNAAILQLRMVWGLLVVAISMLVSPLLNIYFFDGQLSWKYFVIAFLGALFAQLMAQSAEVFRLLYRPWPYIGINLAQTVISVAFVISFTVWLELGILGYFLGFCVGSLITSLIGWASIYKKYTD